LSSIFHTEMFPSVKPANNFLPKAFQVTDTHMGILAYTAFSPSLLSTTGNSGIKVSKVVLEVDIKSQILTPDSVPAATHYNLGLKAI